MQAITLSVVISGGNAALDGGQLQLSSNHVRGQAPALGVQSQGTPLAEVPARQTSPGAADFHEQSTGWRGQKLYCSSKVA